VYTDKQYRRARIRYVVSDIITGYIECSHYRANIDVTQVSGSQLAKSKEDAAAIMRAKQQAGMFSPLHSLVLYHIK
jgi:hypothetical protein